jgi:hypothetical protein
MRRSRFLTCAQLCLAAIVIPSAAKAEDRNQAIMNTIYSKLEHQLGATELNNGFSSGALVLADPGFILDKNVSWDKPEGRKIVYDLIDSSLEPNWLLRFKQQTTSGVYRAVLRYHEAAPSSLTPAEKSQLEAANKVLYEPGPHNPWSRKYLSVDAAKEAYFQAQDDLNTWQREHPDDDPPNVLLYKVARAHDDYFNHPDYAQVMAALDTHYRLSNRDPAVYWGELEQTYNGMMGVVGGATVAPVELYPTYKTWFDPGTHWNTIHIDDSDSTTFKSSSTTSWGGGGSGGWGLWSAGGSYGQTESRTLNQFDTKNFDLTFDVLRVRVRRLWMDDAVFNSRSWRWGKGSIYTGEISDGVPADASTPTGIEPIIVQELILAKNVHLKGNWGTGLATTYHKEVKASGHVGWGPFSFGANYSSTYDEASDHNQVTDNSIDSPDVQIIGAIVSIRPKTPDPDLSQFPAPFVGPSRKATAWLSPAEQAARYNQQYQTTILPQLAKLKPKK